MFGAALGWHSIAVAIGLGLAGESLASVVISLLIVVGIYALLATFAPRGAVVVFVGLWLVSTAVSVVSFLGGNDRGAAIPIVFDAVAVFCAWRAFGLAATYRQDRHRQAERELEYERQERWRPGSGW